MAASRARRRQDVLQRRKRNVWCRLWAPFWRVSYRRLVIMLILIAIAPPFYLHFKLRRLNQIQLKRCDWLRNPPLVCAHGGDSTTALPNTITAYLRAIRSRVDCIEIDVSRSSDGFLLALHDRDLQRISGNYTSKVGFLSMNEIQEMDLHYRSRSKSRDQVSTLEDALTLVSHSVQQVILDVKVGPPSYEKGLAESVLSVVRRRKCKNCIIWAKSDTIVRDVIRLSPNFTVGYIVMKDGHAGAVSHLTRIEKANVVGVYHPLIDERLMRILHGRRKKVYAWTVDDVVSMVSMLSEQVDGVVTSNPSLFQQVMQNVTTHCVEDGFKQPVPLSRSVF